MTSRILACGLLVMTIILPATADALTGTVALSGTSKLAPRGCGKDQGAFATSLVVADDGTWSAQSEDASFAGTYTPKGRSGRKLALAFDEASMAGLIASIVEDVSMLCEAPATVTESRPKAMTLVVNRKLTSATLVVRYLFKGTAAGGSGTATYRLRGKGTWVPG